MCSCIHKRAMYIPSQAHAAVHAYARKLAPQTSSEPSALFAAVVPRDSAWFSFFDGSTVVPLRDQPLYQEDWLGLKRLDARGALLLEEVDGAHMQFSLRWFADNVIASFLA